MKTRFTLLSVSVLILNSCSTEDVSTEYFSNEDVSVEDVSVRNIFEDLSVDEAIEQKPVHVCLDKYIENSYEGSRQGKALVTNKLWDNGQTLKVRFLSGSELVQDRIWEQAIKWESYANIKFERVTSDNADIRINIDDSNASWSYIGTDVQYIDSESATMNFGWFEDATSTSEIARTTLHEFGHALGAIHEHQSPAATIQWDEEAVIEFYANNFDWTEDEVQRNLFNKYSDSEVTNSEYDPYSIMHYAIDNSFTLDDFSIDWNYDLSDLDKSFINETYPFETGGDTDDTTNLALGKETSQLSTEYSADSSRAVDGNTSGYWSDKSIARTISEYRPWWQVRLGTEYAIGDINIYNRVDDCCSDNLENFDVFIYNDKGEQVFKTTVVESPSPMVTINANGVVGSRVRIKLKGEKPLTLAEVEVFEY